jgi:hypothetical protein
MVNEVDNSVIENGIQAEKIGYMSCNGSSHSTYTSTPIPIMRMLPNVLISQALCSLA